MTLRSFLPFSSNAGGEAVDDEFVIDIPRFEQPKPRAP